MKISFKLNSFFENVFDGITKETPIGTHSMEISPTIPENDSPSNEFNLDYFYPKHQFSRDVSKLGFLEKITPREFFQIEECFQAGESFSLNLVEVLIIIKVKLFKVFISLFSLFREWFSIATTKNKSVMKSSKISWDFTESSIKTSNNIINHNIFSKWLTKKTEKG